MNYTQLALIISLLILNEHNVFTMQTPEIPIEIVNNSSTPVTVLFNVHGEQAQFKLLLGKQTLTSSQEKKPIQITSDNSLRIITKMGYFPILMRGNPSAIELYQVSYDNPDSLTSPPIQNILTTKLKPSVHVIIDSTGIPHIQPKDGRPLLGFAAYKLLTEDHLSAITPEEILGITSSDDPKKAYRKKITQWHPDKNKSPEAENITKLINWAAEKLNLISPATVILQQ